MNDEEVPISVKTTSKDRFKLIFSDKRDLDDSEDYYMTQRDKATARSDWIEVSKLSEKMRALKALKDPCL